MQPYETGGVDRFLRIKTSVIRNFAIKKMFSC